MPLINLEVFSKRNAVSFELNLVVVGTVSYSTG